MRYIELVKQIEVTRSAATYQIWKTLESAARHHGSNIVKFEVIEDWSGIFQTFISCLMIIFNLLLIVQCVHVFLKSLRMRINRIHRIGCQNLPCWVWLIWRMNFCVAILCSFPHRKVGERVRGARLRRARMRRPSLPCLGSHASCLANLRHRDGIPAKLRYSLEKNINFLKKIEIVVVKFCEFWGLEQCKGFWIF